MIEASHAVNPSGLGHLSLDLLRAGETLFQSGDLLRAEDCFVECVREDPECADGWSNLGVVLYHLERPVEARCSFENALGLDPSMEAASEGLSLLDSMSDGFDAQSTLEQAVPAIDTSSVPHQDLTLLPAFTTADELAEHLGRILWLVGPYSSEIRNLHIVISDGIEPTRSPKWPSWMDPKVEQIFQQLQARITWHKADHFAQAFAASPQALIWSQEGMESQFAFLRSFGVSENLIEKRCLDLDPVAHRYSVHSAPIAIHSLFGEPIAQDLAQEAERRLALAIDHLKSEGRDLSEWHLLGGGPSVREISWANPGNAVRVVCNRFLENEELCAEVEPSFLAIMDSGYVGCSHAGVDWRRRVATWLSQGLTRYVITMDRFAPWIEAALPTYLRPRLIALPTRSVGLPMSSWHGDLNQNFWLPDAHNVMTSVCLPLAATLAKAITLFGMDGASPTKGYESFGTTYGAQETANEGDAFMDAWYAAHPRIPEDDYSQSYRENLNHSLAEIFEHLENDRGLRIIAGTPSHIPALAQRQVSPR